MSFKKNINPVVSFFLPNNCLICHEPLAYDRHVICNSCFDSMPRLDPGLIPALTTEIPAIQFGNLYIPFQFSDIFQTLIHHFKYRRLYKLGEYFGRELSENICTERYDLLTAVPLHRIRQRERGFNQSSVIAKSMGKCTGIEYRGDVIKRTANNPSQTKLNRNERQKNVERIFRSSYNLDGLTILVIDDVITTGSTLNACCRVLKESGASLIDAAAMATPVDYLQKGME